MPCAVNTDIDPPSVFRRQELINRSENGRKLAAYTYMSQKVPDTCQEPPEEEHSNAMRDDREQDTERVDDQRDLNTYSFNKLPERSFSCLV